MLTTLFLRPRDLIVAEHSAKVLCVKEVWVSGRYGWPRLPVEQSAPSERPGSNPGTPTKKKGPVVQQAEATGSKSVKSGFESQRGHQQSERE